MLAKMSWVAIPLWYVVGKKKAESNHYCILTNWWKERNKSGFFALPRLDPNLYGVLGNNINPRGEMADNMEMEMTDEITHGVI